MGVGGVVPVAAQADGDERAYGVVRALHEAGGAEGAALRVQHAAEESLGILHAAVIRGRDDGVRNVYASVFQRLSGAPNRPFEEAAHAAGFHGRNHLTEVGVFFPQAHQGAQVYRAQRAHKRLKIKEVSLPPKPKALERM